MADPATTRLANTVGYVYEEDDAYTRFEDEEGRGMVTDAYDATKTYAEGALCINDNKLYKAVSAIETAEVWTPDHWTQTNIDAELSSLNTKTNSLQNQCDSGTVNNANKFANFTMDANTENSVDTWICLFNNLQIQHTTPYIVLKQAWTSSSYVELNSTYNCHYQKVGGMCYVYCEYGNINTPQSGVTLGTLPEGYRPKVGQYCRNGFDNQTGAMAVLANGTVSLYSNTSAFTYGRFTVNYPVSL